MNLMPFLIWLAAWGNDPLMQLLPEGTLPPSPAPSLGVPSPTPAPVPSPSTPNEVFSAPPMNVPVPPVLMDSPQFAPGQQFAPGPQFAPGGGCCSDDFCGGPDPVFDMIRAANPNGCCPCGPQFLECYYDPYGSQASYGTCGFQPWRLGWSVYHDIELLPLSGANGGGAMGDMQIVEWNTNFRWSEVFTPGVLFNITTYLNAHSWDGPGAPDLPGSVGQFSTDLELGFFNDGPWSAQVAFHPQMVPDFGESLNNNAFNFDGRAIVSYAASPHWTWVGGVAVWDRVNVLVIPHVGAIWTPAPNWEVRMLYPKSRISCYLGRKWNRDFWVYGSYEYTAGAWQANIGDPTVTEDRIQLSDDRVSVGLRWDSLRFSAFVEGGVVFNREAKFAGPTPDFDLSNVGMVRAGWRF